METSTQSQKKQTKTNLKKPEEEGHSQHTGRFLTRGEDPTVANEVQGQGSSSAMKTGWARDEAGTQLREDKWGLASGIRVDHSLDMKANSC